MPYGKKRVIIKVRIVIQVYMARAPFVAPLYADVGFLLPEQRPSSRPNTCRRFSSDSWPDYDGKARVFGEISAGQASLGRPARTSCQVVPVLVAGSPQSAIVGQRRVKVANPRRQASGHAPGATVLKAVPWAAGSR